MMVHRLLVAGVALAAALPARAEVVVEVDGAVNLGYSATTNNAPIVDPNDAPSAAIHRVYTDLRPGIALRTASPRLAWRFGYVFSGAFGVDQTTGGSGTYANLVDAALAAELSPRTTMGFGASVTQGGTAFQLSLRPAEAGQPALRAPDNPARVAATLRESLTWEASPFVRLGQALSMALSAPQDQLGKPNVTLANVLFVNRSFARSAFGAELRSSASSLQPLGVDADRYLSISNAVLGRLSRDLGWRWSGSLAGGVQQVLTFAGSYPLSLLPTGNASLRYATRATALGLSADFGATTNEQTGTVAISQSVVLNGVVNLTAVLPRSIGLSVGYMHSEPLGEASPLVAAGTGNAVSADLGLTWFLSETLVATGRYSLAYQFSQAGGLEDSMAHVLLVGVTARYVSDRRRPRPLPTAGQRVDGSDAVPFDDRDAREP